MTPISSVPDEWLNQKCGHKVNMIYPKRGKNLERIDMVKRNAKNFLRFHIEKINKKAYDSSTRLEKLKQELNLTKIPMRIEAFDISNTSGSEATGSMIVFENGDPYKKDYRRFKIKTVTGIDDLAMMQEIVRRRYSGTQKEKLSPPDLIIIDGGKGQLNAAYEVLNGLKIKDIEVISLAKKFEEIYKVNAFDPIKLPNNSTTLLLLQKIRDEAHRFAIKYHRLLRGKRFII
ncbi:hypothetical protein HZA55_00840 [Candidatus Poribacteria bacterium]|nr:hypothetical protein [Candidatus Poribacteria bacterium]